MSRYIGNYLRVPSLEPQQASAPGIWSLSEQLNYQRANLWPPARDPYYNQTVLHLSGDVAATRETNPVTQPRTFLSDASSNNFLLTPNGDVSARPFSPYSNNYSNYFNGSSSVNFANNAGFDFSTGDFTIESWVYIAGNSPLDGSSRRYASIFSVATTNNYNVSFIVRGDSTTTGTGLEIYNGTSAIAVTGSISQNAWNHVAVSRSGANAYFWLNGQQMGAAQSISGSWGSSANPGQVGQSSHTYSYSFPLIGYLSNVRVVKGRAVYTSAFTPSTTPLTRTSGGTNPPQGTECVLLTCQSNRFLDSNGPNVPASSPLTTTVTGSPVVAQNSPFVEYDTTSGSGYFDGNADYLTTPTGQTNLTLGTGNFTIDFWFYPTTQVQTLAVLFASVQSITYTNGILVQLQSSTTFDVYMGGTAIKSAIAYVQNQWNHLVVQRSGTSTMQVWMNGIEITGVAASATDLSTNSWVVGYWFSSGHPFTGYISNFRIVKGYALYSGTTITVPTAPVTAVYGTQLLLNATNAGIWDASGRNNFETVGDAKVSTAAGRYSIASLAFDGTGDYLTFPSNNLFSFGTGDFTIEAWIYATTLTSKGVFQTSDNPGGLKTTYTSGLLLCTADAANGQLAVNVLGTTVNTGSTYIAINTWYHVAVTRLSGNISIFLNGVLAGGPTSVASAINGSYLCVGGYYNSSYLWNGYISDFRITRVARYTANFTAPTAPVRLK